MWRMINVMLALASALALLSACSKTMDWEEEVLLNTGETIWVKRSATYSNQGGAGNPLDRTYRIDESPSLKFSYGGKSYSYQGKGALMLIAISPQKIPVLAMAADSGRWDAKHKYKCTYPFYVQFVPDATGTAWSWPPSIEPWLIGLETNLLGDYGKPEKILPKFTLEEKAKQPYLRDPALASFHRIEPSYTGDLCKHKGK